MVSRIKIELIDDVQQVRPAENLLRNALHPFLQVIVDIRRDIVFRHGGLLDQNQRARLVPRRQNPTRSPHHRPADKQRYQEMEVATAHYSQIMLKVEAFPALLFQIRPP